VPPAIAVAHSHGSYHVHVAPGILERGAELIAAALGDRRTAVVTDATLLSRLGGWGITAGEAGPLVVPPGELAKTRAQWAELTDQLLARGIGRDGALIAVGGGSVGDLTGFVAATYLRGIPFVQVPTTLLAMLDASVGGKVGVDTPRGKNLVGAFHPPALVLSDPLVLASLPERDYRGGLAEAVKHGLVADQAYFAWIRENAAALGRRDPAALAHLVRRSVEIKAAVVAADEREAGQRAILNAGHTVAHALEHVSGHAVPHGEAVALGLLAESALAESLGMARATAGPLREALTALGLPTRVAPPLDPDRLLGAMRHDKKNRQDRIRFSLVEGVGRPRHEGGSWTTPAEERQIREALATIL
jgi:3-dehydroquinate synthase